MELLKVIALLCQVHPATGSGLHVYSPREVDSHQLSCQQRYIHCVRTKPNSMQEAHRLEQCIMEKK